MLYPGVISNGCVLRTPGAGFDLGYRGYFISDATENIVGAHMAQVVTTDDIIAKLAAG